MKAGEGHERTCTLQGTMQTGRDSPTRLFGLYERDIISAVSSETDGGSDCLI